MLNYFDKFLIVFVFQVKKFFCQCLYWCKLIDKKRYKRRKEKLREKYQLRMGKLLNTADQALKYLCDANHDRLKKFVKITEHPYEYQDGDTKVIAYYLPQFHRIPINDCYHGKGFTEWTNAARAMPMFIGHEQPHLPYDVGFYDLMNIDTFKRQIELAKMYGIYGFCFHWYWFSGERTMEKPVELFLRHKELDIKFCFNWATENWTALWDGGNKEVMFTQELKQDDDRKFFDDILPYFKDERYIKIDGKPVLSVYNVKIFPKERFRSFVDNMQAYAKEEGFPGIYFLITNTFYFDENVADYGADALVEFPPSFVRCDRLMMPVFNPYFKGKIFDFVKFWERKSYLRKYKSEVYYRSALTSWDNTARKAFSENCDVYYGANPSTFYVWLKDIIAESKKIHSNTNDIVFVNSWNEWAEGSHLEPCLRYGYGYLQAVKDAIEINRPVREDIIVNQLKNLAEKGIDEPNIYVLCLESLGDIIACEPISRYLKKITPKAKIRWIVKEPYTEVLTANENIDEIISVDCLTTGEELCLEKAKDEKNVIINCHYDKRICSKTGRVFRNLNNPQVNEETYFNYGSLLETFCLSAGLKPLGDAPVFHFTSNEKKSLNLPAHYIVLHCKSAEKIKDWNDKKWNKLSDILLSRGYCIVEIGENAVIKSKSKNFFNHTGRRSIQELAEIIRHADLLISVDSAFAHVANCCKVKSVILLGKYKNFETYFPYTGEWAHKGFEIVRAPQNQATEFIQVSAVVQAVEKQMKKN